MNGFAGYFCYSDIAGCKTEVELQAQFDLIICGFSGIPSASVLFNHALNQKEALDWLMETAIRLDCNSMIGKAKEYRKQVVETLQRLLI